MKKLLLLLVGVSGFFTTFTFAATGGVMPYDANFTPPPGYIKIVDDISNPQEMVIMERYPADEQGHDFAAMSSYTPAMNYALPTTALKNTLITSNGETTWVPQNVDTFIENWGNWFDWLSDPVDAGDGLYELMHVNGDGQGKSFIDGTESIARFRLIYTGPSFEGYGCVNYSGASYIGSVVLNPDGTAIGCGEPANGDEDIIPLGGIWQDWITEWRNTWENFTTRLGFACDDCRMGSDGNEGEEGIPIGFNINYYGSDYDKVFVNSNGSISFGRGSDEYDQPLEQILGGVPGVCAYCIDLENNDQIQEVIQSGTGWSLSGAQERHSDFVYRGRTTFEGRSAFVATWINMPAYSTNEEDQTWNTFQIMLVDIDDETDDVDIIVNYGSMRNENEQGYCLDGEEGEEDCNHLAIGLGTANEDGSQTVYNSIVSDSGIVLNGMTTQELWDEGTTPLREEHLNSNIPGRFIFQMRGGALPGSEISYSPGCKEPQASNYNANASSDNGECAYTVLDLSALGSDGQIALTWNPATSGASWALSSYSVRYNPGNISIDNITNTETGIILSGLNNNGINYTIQVCAIYIFGDGGNTTEACTNINSLWTTTPQGSSFGGGGGGSNNSVKDSCPNGDYTTSYYDGECGKKNIIEPSATGTGKETITLPANDIYNTDITDGFCFKRKNDINIIDSNTIKTTAEFKKALTFLYSYDLSMYNSIDEFKITESMTRQQAAKMFSNFAINVLCRKPNDSKPNYTDIENADPSLIPYIKLSYQLGLMKGSADGSSFRPYDIITKAELNAVLTRMILNGMLDESNEIWYTEYNKVANKLGIINQGAGTESVSRHDAALMLFRAYKQQAFTLQDIGYKSYILKNRDNFIK